MKDYLALNAQVLYWVVVAPFRGRWFHAREVFRQLVIVASRALPMVALTAFSVGFTLAMQSASELRKLGGEMFVPDLVSVSLLRELGPVLIAVIVIGRSGSAFTAELGTMKVSEEVEALEVMAINPIRFLVVPRVLALVVALPLLTVLGNCVGIAGGWTVCRLFLGMSTEAFILHGVRAADSWDLYSGLVKSVVFAWIVGTVACKAGLGVEGGAAGVGRATTHSVVTGLLAMLVANAVLTAIFFFGE